FGPSTPTGNNIQAASAASSSALDLAGAAEAASFSAWSRKARGFRRSYESVGARRRLCAAALPAHALRRVLEHDAFGSELVADGVGAREIAGLFRCRAFVDQRLDAGVVVAGCTAAEPVGRCLLQQAER